MATDRERLEEYVGLLISPPPARKLAVSVETAVGELALILRDLMDRVAELEARNDRDDTARQERNERGL